MHVSTPKKWCCWYHANASIDGIEVQTQKKALLSSTQKTLKSAQTGADLTNAPMKKSTKKTKQKLTVQLILNPLQKSKK